MAVTKTQLIDLKAQGLTLPPSPGGGLITANTGSTWSAPWDAPWAPPSSKESKPAASPAASKSSSGSNVGALVLVAVAAVVLIALSRKRGT